MITSNGQVDVVDGREDVPGPGRVTARQLREQLADDTWLDEEALGVVRTGENTDPAMGSVLTVLAVRESSATATLPWNRQRDCQPHRQRSARPRR